MTIDNDINGVAMDRCQTFNMPALVDISNRGFDNQRTKNRRSVTVEVDGLDSFNFVSNGCNINRLNGATDTSIDQLCQNLDTVELRQLSRTCRDSVISISEEELAFQKILLSENFDLGKLTDQDKDGDTFLHIAIIFLQPDIASLCILCINSAEMLSKQNRLWQSPMHLAVLTGLVTVVRELVSSGADILSRDKDGNTPFSIACRDGMHNIVETILNTAFGNGRVSPTSKGNCIDSKILFSVPNYEGDTCLHLASNRGHVDLVLMLVRHGADVNTKAGKTGRSILHNACLAGDTQLVRALLDVRSCDINAKAYDGLTSFDLARHRGQDEICSILAAKGARVGSEDDEDSD